MDEPYNENGRGTMADVGFFIAGLLVGAVVLIALAWRFYRDFVRRF